LIINVELARDVFRIFVCCVSHKFISISICPPLWRAVPPKASPFGILFAGPAPAGGVGVEVGVRFSLTNLIAPRPTDIRYGNYKLGRRDWLLKRRPG
jgi:hypothetical protein